MNRNVKNAELRANKKIANLLAAGHVIVVDKIQTKNENYVDLYLAAEVAGLNSNGGTVTQGAAFLLGWGQNQIIRCRQTVTTANANEVEIGKSLNEVFGMDFTLKVKDSLEPAWPEQAPRVTNEGILLVNEDGKSVYRNALLVTKEEFEGDSHVIIKVTAASEAKKVSAAKLLSGTTA